MSAPHLSAALARFEATTVHRDAPAPRGRRYRGNLRFVREADVCRPIDRNQRARILAVAEALERRTKAPGRRNGALGLATIVILRALLIRFANSQTGLCSPSYTALQAATGFCRQTIADGLYRLEQSGLVTVVRRLVRERVTRVNPATGLIETFVATVQGSNLFRFNAPSAQELVPIPRHATRRRVAKFVRPESAEATGNHHKGQPGKSWVSDGHRSLGELLSGIGLARATSV